jgi:hypothetical protein
MKSPLLTASTIAIAVIVILGTLVPAEPLVTLKIVLLDWAITVGAVAAFIAILNLVSVHGRNVLTEEKKNFYSLFFLISFIAVFTLGLFLGASHPFFKSLSNSIIVSVETSLLALLAFSLAIACFRLFKQKHNALGLVFGLSTVVFLITLSGVFSNALNSGLFNQLTNFINQIPIAGIRGIVIGISLGTIATGIRVLIGVDRPYRG